MKQQIPMGAIIGIAVAVLGVIGFFVWRTFGDDGHGTVSSADVSKYRASQAQSQQENMKKSAEKARMGGGGRPGMGGGGYGGRGGGPGGGGYGGPGR